LLFDLTATKLIPCESTNVHFSLPTAPVYGCGFCGLISTRKKLQCDLGEAGLIPPQFYVLATIGYAGSLPFGEIGAKMMVTVSNLTGIVDRLEQKNWSYESAMKPTGVLFT
jgi:hypothetical protein